MLLTEQLNAYAQAGFHVYFGNMKVRADVPGNFHITIRKAFLQSLRHLSRENGCFIRIYCLSEIGRDLRLHDHYAMVSNSPISKAIVKRLWDKACAGNPTTVQHRPPWKAIEAAVKYMAKNRWVDHTGKPFIRLFERGSIPMTWGSRPFFLPSKDELWKAIQRSSKQQQKAAAIPG